MLFVYLASTLLDSASFIVKLAVVSCSNSWVVLLYYPSY